MSRVATPNAKTIEAVAKQLGLPASQNVKTLIVEGDEDGALYAIILRGDHELNEIKAAKLPGVASPLTFAAEERIPKAMGASVGSLGPGNRLAEKQAIAFAMADYADMVIEQGGNLHQITRHMLGLFTGERGAKYWRRQLGEATRLQPYNTDILRETAEFCCSQINREVA